MEDDGLMSALLVCVVALREHDLYSDEAIEAYNQSSGVVSISGFLNL